LAADIQRYLKDEPISARPPSASYQLSKFARRNRTLVAGGAAVLVVLLAGVVATTWLAVRANRERDRATTAERAARAVNDFLQNDLLAQASAKAQANHTTSPDADLKVRTALDRAAVGIDGKFAGQPAVEAAIRETSATPTRLWVYTRKRKSRSSGRWRSIAVFWATPINRPCIAPDRSRVCARLGRNMRQPKPC
jgi:hypothetical protein